MDPGTTLDFPTVSSAYCSPLAKLLFRVDGVKGVFFGSDFITITKIDDDSVEWKVIKPEVFAIIMDFFHRYMHDFVYFLKIVLCFHEIFVIIMLDFLKFHSGLPIVNEDAVTSSDTEIYDDDSDTVAMIKELLDSRIRPTVQVFSQNFNMEL